MPSSSASWRGRRAGEFLAYTLVFGVSYTQLPLFTSNQTHHFLAGLARAGLGWLRDDWQVHTVDPFPVFTAIVAFVHVSLGDWWFYLGYQALIGAYIWGMLGIVGEVMPACRSGRVRLFLFTILTALHSEGFGYVLGFDPLHMPWWQMSTWGLAEQEILGHAMFQGSAFGMLLPLALLLFLRGRSWWAVSLAGAAVVVHPGYALLAGSLVAAFVIQRARTRTERASTAAAAAWFALVVAPVLIHAWMRFAPTDADTWRAATSVLVQHLPRETSPFLWFGTKAWLQIGLVAAGVWAARKTPLALYMMVPLALGGSLSAVQMATGDAALALTFPWRVSVLLVPLSTAVLVGRGLASVDGHSSVATSNLLRRLCLVALTLLALGGVLRMSLHFGYFYGITAVTGAADRVIPAAWVRQFSHDLRTDSLGMLQFVRSTRVRGETYLIPLDLERFRIDTGAPAYVDLKSHPYKDTEVLVWLRRVEITRRVMGPTADCQALENLGRAGTVTHVVAARRSSVASCAGLTRAYADDDFEVLSLAFRRPDSR